MSFSQMDGLLKLMKTIRRFIFFAFAVAALRVCGQNLVQNGGFQTGTLADWAGSGVVVTSGKGLNGSDAAVFTTPADSSPATLYQVLPLVYGDTYDLSFWLASPNDDSVNFGLAFSIGYNPSGGYGPGGPYLGPGFSYTEYSFTNLQVQVGEYPYDDYLYFEDYGPSGGIFYLDDVTVTVVTEVPDSGPGLFVVAPTLLGICGVAYLLRRRSFA